MCGAFAVASGSGVQQQPAAASSFLWALLNSDPEATANAPHMDEKSILIFRIDRFSRFTGGAHLSRSGWLSNRPVDTRVGHAQSGRQAPGNGASATICITPRGRHRSEVGRDGIRCQVRLNWHRGRVLMLGVRPSRAGSSGRCSFSCPRRPAVPPSVPRAGRVRSSRNRRTAGRV